MAEETWHAARLIPTSGINGAEEAERRATSALLAVLSAVKEFGRAVLKPLGAPAGTIDTYIEVPFELPDGSTVYPDGLIRVRRGSTYWTALVEVKTGTHDLRAEQLENYLDVARAAGFDALLTISNQLPPAPGVHPTRVDGRKLKKVDLRHVSWVQIMTEAVMQKEHRGVADPDQAWILGELIRYLEHNRSGALTFEDMGPSWVPVREAVRSGTLVPSDATITDVATRFDGLLRYAGLRLGQRLGTDVQPVLSRKELADPALRLASLATSLVESGRLSGAIRIPDAAATMFVVADLRTSRVECWCDIAAPGTGRNRTRVSWLLRQLKDAPSALRIESFVLRGRGAVAAELLERALEDPTLLAPAQDKELRSFRLTELQPMGTKRGTGRGSFIDSVVSAIDGYYGSVLQNLRAWAPAAPRLREEPEVPEGEGSLVSTDRSSQDLPDLPGG